MESTAFRHSPVGARREPDIFKGKQLKASFVETEGEEIFDMAGKFGRSVLGTCAAGRA